MPPLGTVTTSVLYSGVRKDTNMKNLVKISL